MVNLPIEITAEILSRLPPRYVLLCRSVCKTWRNIIDDHRFKRLQFTRALKSDEKSTFIFLPCDSHAVYIVEQVENDSQSHLFKATKIDFSCPENCSLYANPCNGFICFSHHDKSSGGTVYYTYIYNPTTRECVQLPDFVSRIRMRSLGFGFDRSSNMFKVLQMISFRGGIRHAIQQAQISTLVSDSWKILENFPFFLCSTSMPALVNESLHWLSRDEGILSFDLVSESFGRIEVPQFGFLANPMSSFLSDSFRLVALGGCLSVVDSSFDDHVELWIMKDYNVKESWVKHIIMRKYAKDGVLFKNVLPISVWKNGEILLLYDSRILVSYEIESRRYTPLKINGLPECKFEDGTTVFSYEVYPYVGNLMSLETMCKLEEQPSR